MQEKHRNCLARSSDALIVLGYWLPYAEAVSAVASPIFKCQQSDPVQFYTSSQRHFTESTDAVCKHGLSVLLRFCVLTAASCMSMTNAWACEQGDAISRLAAEAGACADYSSMLLPIDSHTARY